jgi:2-phosphosulfolactate phosphatase
MPNAVVIDCLPESVRKYRSGWAIVAVDVIRATTTAVTAALTGRRCFPAPDVQAALAIARRLENPLLAGDSRHASRGVFEMENSPAHMALRTDIHRPLVLVSSTGTRVIHEAAGSEAVYLACFRTHSAVARYVARRHPRVAVIGAGSKGEFREEDQMCCAWIAAALIRRGHAPATPETAAVVRRWRNAPASACLSSRSVEFLRRTNQLSDLDFILAHIDDVRQVFEVRDGEVKMSAASDRPPEHVIDKQDNDGANHRHNQAVQIHPAYSGGPKEREQPSSNDCAHDAQQDVLAHPGSFLIHDLAADKPGQQTQNNPCKERHTDILH